MANTDRDSQITIMALGVLAACFTTAAHEAFGHGGVCLATGGRVAQLTTVYFQCAPGSWYVAAAGPLGNLLWALTAWLAQGLVRRGPARLFLALTMTLSLSWEAGYLLYAMIKGDGDAYFALRGAFGGVSAFARIATAAGGVVLYFIASAALRAGVQQFATEPGRVAGLKRTAWIAASLAAAIAAALFAPQRSASFIQGCLEVGAASAPVLLLGRSADKGGDAPRLRVEPSWIVAAAIVYLAFAATLGRGLP
jgi:hypothetical protein